MRLHLTIQRHGLPVTRILWTTSPPSLFGHNHPNPSSLLPATSSAVTSSRMPNALYANGGYTIAQLLEDVNEVIPLETEPRLFEDESSGQWGLEDYAVEVGGSECLHFMEIEGILRDGDEVLIRALQVSDLKVRQISGRHQISADGRHLIDGVPFGKPFLKRPTSSRPAITIPPRKKRRTALALWGTGNAYEEEDSEWAPPVPRHGTGKELSLLNPESEAEKMDEDVDEYEDAYQDDYEDYHEPNEDGEGTVIRHHVDKTSEGTESDNVSGSESGDLSQELQDLKKDIELSGLLPELEEPDASRRGDSARPRPSIPQPALRKSSLSRRSTGDTFDGEASRRESKSVSFGKQKQELPTTKLATSVPRAGSISEEAEDSVSNESDSDSDSDSSPSGFEASDSSDEESSSDESESESASEPEIASAAAPESSSGSESDSSSERSASESERSEAEQKEVSKASHAVKPVHEANPPGAGSERTRKCNRRAKMRRRLTKLKQMGFLEENADFDALREWDSKNTDSSISNTGPNRINRKTQEQEVFEAKRRKLLRDLESGGVDVSFVSEKENLTPRSVGDDTSELPEDHDETYETANDTTPANAELTKRRSLDVASTRRLLFGSLGVRNPRSKEEEEATRKKLAGKARPSTVQQTKSEANEQASTEDREDESEVNWREKLTVGATECVFDDIELSAPPFPFEQHWDTEAGDEMRRRRGRNKKRKRRQQLQVYDEEAYGNEVDYYGDDDQQLNYDDAEQPGDEAENKDLTRTRTAADTEDDLPDLPEDASGLPGLTTSELKPGLVFAFKQLDVSKATNWQPMVLDYRIAVISEVFDDNILKIQLAKPYRRQPKDAYAEGGPFSYSGFEMPGMEDDEELDYGIREVPFDDLLEPKVLRAAPAADAGEKDTASIFPADDEQPAQEPSQSVIDEPAASDGHDDQLVEVSSQRALSSNEKQVSTPDPALQEGSLVQSPRFEGFEDSAMMTIESDPVDLSYIRDEIQGNSPKGDDSQSQLQSTCPPNVDSHDLQETGTTDQLQTISSPVSIGSYHKLMNFFLHPSPKREEKGSPVEPRSEPGSPMVPNPFYEIDKAREERRQRSLPKTQRDRSYDSASGRSSRQSSKPAEVDDLSSSPPKRARKRKAPSPVQDRGKERGKERETSPVSIIPDSVQGATRDQTPPSSQMPASQMPDPEFIVDLTQSSPPVSPGGSDEDFAKTHRLPRGSGWVQKNNQATRRQTRQSSASSRVIRTLDTGSISPPRRRRGRRSRS
ncbi:uncharacterized protein DSM5745_10736 [Aspergillus mulundensis]|uniref:DUF7357 domain-containing protein n=1 Tax=Aspergillus mulundensis TaxID=1810919 RepID=A0A3D8QHR2_9EURO|nr:hypothetical protein DSM5745_10736 [Aspergillus mulundensis]RDW61238.1 hypothetical protein DSM5745_10736 [Aspergillus mulundensis]